MQFIHLGKVNDLNDRLQRLISMRINTKDGAYLYKNRITTQNAFSEADKWVFVDRELLGPLLDLEIEATKTQLRKLGIVFDE